MTRSSRIASRVERKTFSASRSGHELRRLQCAGEARSGIRRDACKCLRRQLARVRTARLRPRSATLNEREDGDRADDDERDERGRDERPQPAALPPRGDALALELIAGPPGEQRLREHVVEDLVARRPAGGTLDDADDALVP